MFSFHLGQKDPFYFNNLCIFKCNFYGWDFGLWLISYKKKEKKENF